MAEKSLDVGQGPTRIRQGAGLLMAQGMIAHFAGTSLPEELFPTSYFRMAYDLLRKRDSRRAHKEYLQILYLAARESESEVNAVLRRLIELEQPITAAAVKDSLGGLTAPAPITAVSIAEVNLAMYDVLLRQEAVAR